MEIQIKDCPFDPWSLIADFQGKHLTPGRYGATSIFIGSMRDANEGSVVQSMTLEHYPGMTEKYLSSIVTEAESQWELMETLIVHRVGEVLPDDTIVIVAVWAEHRAHAYEANRYLMEKLKSSAPFWKKETLENKQERWVEKNTPGSV